jgi:2-keto-4-pentenoate hydratase/2-oxohepta-3-ene-1,7-dioic acid hydratase in catechol pathway
MKLFLGYTPSSLPNDTRIFGQIDGKLIDLRLAAAALYFQGGNQAAAYELAGYYFPATIAAFLKRGEIARKELEQIVAFARGTRASPLLGPAGEKVSYDAKELRLLPPLPDPERSFVIGFSDRARAEAKAPLQAEIATGFYKLPQTFVTDGAPIIWPKFSRDLDADGCLAIVIGRSGKRIAPEKAWDYVAGVALMIDITARDINRREGLTTNNLLGKNFPSSTCLGPAVLIGNSRADVETLTVELSLDGVVKQTFSLRHCVFTVEQIIARWSILGIKPGDWLAIGASMCLEGSQLKEPVSLKIGSTLRCSSPVHGESCHRIVAAGGNSR